MYIWAGTGCRSDVVERHNLSTFTYEQRHLTIRFDKIAWESLSRIDAGSGSIDFLRSAD